MTKTIFASKTVWGVLLAALPTLAPLFGLSFGQDDAAMVSQAVDAIITAVGTLLGIYGRVTAVKDVTLL